MRSTASSLSTSGCNHDRRRNEQHAAPRRAALVTSWGVYGWLSSTKGLSQNHRHRVLHVRLERLQPAGAHRTVHNPVIT